MHGPFIVLEGPDGAGTTKHSVLLAERLKNEGHMVLRTFEPTDGPIGSAIRLDLQNHLASSPLSLQQRFCDDRAWHVMEVIEPTLARGATVISDRYLHSTIAYGLAMGVDRKELEEMNKLFVRPDCTLFLLPPFEVLQERMGRREQTDDLEKVELQKKVYENYRLLAREDPSIIVIDTSGAVEDVAEMVYQEAMQNRK